MDALLKLSGDLADDLLQVEVKLLRYMTSADWPLTDVNSQMELRRLLQAVVDSREMAEERVGEVQEGP